MTVFYPLTAGCRSSKTPIVAYPLVFDSIAVLVALVGRAVFHAGRILSAVGGSEYFAWGQRQSKTLVGRCLTAAVLWGLTGVLLWGNPLSVPPAIAQPSQPYLVQAAEQLELDGKQLAEGRDFDAAAVQFEQAGQIYRERGDGIGEAVVMSHLATVRSQLGQWEAADRAIERSFSLLERSHVDGADGDRLAAQLWDVRGRLFFDRDRLEDAFDAWSQSQQLFVQSGDIAGNIRLQIEQARVLQALGYYGRAIDRLTGAIDELPDTSDLSLQSLGLRQIGNALLLAGDAVAAEDNLLQSLDLAQQLGDVEGIAASQLSLGNVARWLNDPDGAADYYERAAASSRNPQMQLSAELNHLEVLLVAERWPQLQQRLMPVKERIAVLPPSRGTLQARVKLLALIARLRPKKTEIAPDTDDILAWAIATRQQARELADRRAEAQTLGLLGHIYEQGQQLSDALVLTDEANALAQAGRNYDVAYRVQWQLGRILVAQDNVSEAIDAYQSALTTLDILRRDLTAVNPDLQFAFQDSIEPVHRQLVELLLATERRSASDLDAAETDTTQPPSSESAPASNELTVNGASDVPLNRLDMARKTLERLQLAELDNFFRAACIDSVPVAIEDVDADAAVIYPIVLADRLELLLHLPGLALKQVTVDANSDELDRVVDLARLAFGQRTSPRYLPLAQQLYDWIVRPIAADLADAGVDTLVFVPDGVLRNVPMGALHDGEGYLIERYAIAVSPGLELLPPEPFDTAKSRILTAGLSQPRQGFTGLAHVIAELDKIDASVEGRSLRDRDFTQQSLQAAMGDDDFSFVHIATHGQFSSQLDRTFLLAWDDTIDVNQLRSLIVASDFSRDRPLDLLVLSACETAAGDRRAALGLAGIATRSGARSTVATLWKVSDEMTADIVDRFYQNLVLNGMTKAKALQQAQLAIYNQVEAEQRHPYYWGAFVLVGNWQ